MLDLWKRLFVDSIAQREIDADRARKREVIPPDMNPGELDVRIEPAPASTAHALRCRVCGNSGPPGAKDRFCLRCLAETMEAHEPRAHRR